VQIEELSTDSLIPYEFNNVVHSDEQINRIANSITQFGFNTPVVVNSQNVIIAGHGRVEAAKKLGREKVPVVRIENLTPVQEKAYRILDNKLTRDSECNMDSLRLEGEMLKEAGFDFEEWGLKSLFQESEVDAQVVEDDFEGASVDEVSTFIKRGDLIELGRHRVLCGDSAEDDLEKCDLLLTDPPYGVSMDKGFAGSDGFGGEGKAIPRRQYVDTWDSERPSGEVFARMLEATSRAIIFGGNFFADLLPKGEHWIFWDKEQTMPTFGDGELAWTNIPRKSVKKITHTYNGLIGKEKERFHPTQKPVKLIAKIIHEYGEGVKTILDPFLGSGTTLIASEQLSRTCIGVEREPKYCQVIIDRYQKYCSDNNKPFECKINGEAYERP
jgi:DNA modification methylase